MTASTSSKAHEALNLAETPVLDSEEAIESSQDAQEFPDGGAKAWLTVAGGSACLFVSFGWVNCVGLFQQYYQTHQLRHYTPSEIAWIPSLQCRYYPIAVLWSLLFNLPY